MTLSGGGYPQLGLPVLAVFWFLGKDISIKQQISSLLVDPQDEEKE
jgi:hypothetical protein